MSELPNFTNSRDILAEHSPAVRLENVSCRIGKKTILDQISLSIAKGNIAGILGSNGAGKTTFLNLISGLRHPSEGTLSVLNQPLRQRSLALRQRIGNVFQETALHDELTAQENLRFAASLYDIPNPKQRIEEVLDLLSLTLRSQERVGHLSGGLRRRVAIARALLHAPDLLLIDEPTLGVDVETRHIIWAHLRLLRSQGTTIIVSTNYLDEALALCDTVSVLRDGRILVTTDPAVLVAEAGCCLDIECSSEAAGNIVSAFAGPTRTEGVLQIIAAPAGLSIFLSRNIVPEDIIQRILQAGKIQGFRIRGADLAEIFQSLETKPQAEFRE